MAAPRESMQLIEGIEEIGAGPVAAPGLIPTRRPTRRAHRPESGDAWASR